MAALKILVVGGGIAGPAFAFWLAKAGHDVTIVERSPNLRAQGQQIDIRSQAVKVIRKMGLIDTIRSKVVDEEGLRFENVFGVPQAELIANKTGEGAQGFTSEFEIMRGDLCRIFYDASCKEGASYVFGKSVRQLDQDHEGVTAYFSNGETERFDLVVGADGQGSKIRKMILPEGEDSFKSLNIFTAYYTIPREPRDLNKCTVCNIPSRTMVIRPDNPKTAQAYLTLYDPNGSDRSRRLRDAFESRDVQQQKQVWASIFEDAGWQAPRMIEEMNENSLAEDFYTHELGQVIATRWSEGRVVLLGDAASCPSPMSGMGTSSALVAAYVLAGEIAKKCPARSEDGAATTKADQDKNIKEALSNYEDVFGPFAKKAQYLPPGVPGLLNPQTWWGVRIMHFILWLVTLLRIDQMAMMFTSDDVKGWDLPDYPEMEGTKR